MTESSMSHTLKPYKALAELVRNRPPKWLAEHFMDWTWTLQGIRGGQEVSPTRSSFIKHLKRADASIHELQELLTVPQYTAFLQLAAPDEFPPIDDLVKHLGQLRLCVGKAYKSKQLTESLGKASAGRGKVKLPGEIPAMAWCAMFVAEVFSHFDGVYPANSDPRAARVAEAWWGVIGGKRRSWGNNPLMAWRRHFKQAREPEIEKLNRVVALRRHYREQLRMRAAVARRHV